ncbi:hypothetical protein [Chryseobacterium sp. c4a]|uniref:hypothetical protein n=1 Tax=Chryseobacterium sp. c4a TaxID=1573582 RepID=UPI001356D4C7|nr:hypothetical protein [Chryseobacterium sp. c4a]
MKTESTNERYSSESGIMSNELMKVLIDNYRQNQMNAINKTMGIEDANSIWFDLPKLKNFIALMENEAHKIDPECTPEDLGIRFYYAAYPKMENWGIMESHPVSPEYSGRHTLVMIPTLKKELEGEVFNCDFHTLQIKKRKSPNLALTARGQEPPGELGENSGILSPPGNSRGMF